MKRTLLDMTQSILGSLGSDEVNSISDTTESLQVADIIKNTYYNIVNRLDLPNHWEFIQLEPSLDAAKPVLMFVPEGITKIEWLKYFNTDVSAGGPVPGYQYVTILPIQQFTDMTAGFNPDETGIESFDFTIGGRDYTFYFRNDRQPCYCTMINNQFIIFDAFNAAEDNTLQASKTQAYGEISPTFIMTDSFVPNLSDEQFPLLFNESKALAFFELKQSAHPKAEQEAKRGWSAVQRDKAVVNRPTYFEALPDFGRRSTAGVSYFKTRGWDRP